MTYQSAIEWTETNISPENYTTLDEFLEDVRDEFQNDNLIDNIEQDLIQIFEGSREF